MAFSLIGGRLVNSLGLGLGTGFALACVEFSAGVLAPGPQKASPSPAAMPRGVIQNKCLHHGLSGGGGK